MKTSQRTKELAWQIQNTTEFDEQVLNIFIKNLSRDLAIVCPDVKLHNQPLPKSDKHVCGFYRFDNQTIYVYRKNSKGKITDGNRMLETLVHEFCHHIDYLILGEKEISHGIIFKQNMENIMKSLEK